MHSAFRITHAGATEYDHISLLEQQTHAHACMHTHTSMHKHARTHAPFIYLYLMFLLNVCQHTHSHAWWGIVCVGLWGKGIPEVVPLVSVRLVAVHHEIKG